LGALFGEPVEQAEADQPPVTAPESKAGSGLFAPQDLPWETEGEQDVSTFNLDLDTGEMSLETPAAEPAAEPLAEESAAQAPEPVFSLDEEIPVLDLELLEKPTVEEEKFQPAVSDALQFDLQGIETPQEAAAEPEQPRLEEQPEIFDLDLQAAEAQPEAKSEAEPVQEAVGEAAEEDQLAGLTRLAELETPGVPIGTLDFEAPAEPAPAEPVAETTSAEPAMQAADLIPLEELDEAPTAKPPITEPEFDEEVDSALDGLFSGEPLEEAPEEVLRYDVAATGSSDEATNPKVHYDLGLAYKEMGLVEDAVQEFQTAAQMLKSPIYNPQRILCCSMLANSLLQLGHYVEAHRWAEEGLRIPGKKEFEWKALKYDSASALERQGKHPEALEAFREILDRDPEYRDVLTRIDNLLRTQ